MSLTYEGKAVIIVFLDLINSFGIAPHKFIIMKLLKYGLDEQTVGWIKNWSKSWTQRAVVSVSQGSVLGQILFHFFISDLDDGK